MLFSLYFYEYINTPFPIDIVLSGANTALANKSSKELLLKSKVTNISSIACVHMV